MSGVDIERCVVIESPFKGRDNIETKRNVLYARLCMDDCSEHGEFPFASHLYLTQVTDDTNGKQREYGMRAGLEIAKRLDVTVVYVDLGWSDGMVKGITAARDAGRPVEYRSLGNLKEVTLMIEERDKKGSSTLNKGIFF